MASLKEQKEAFVTGHEGTTAAEVFLICLSTPIGLALYRQVLLRLTLSNGGNISSISSIQLLLECLFFILPVILCQSTWLFPWGVLFLVIEIGMMCVIIVALPSHTQQSTAGVVVGSRPRRLGFITAYRSSLLYLTFCAILAVDFPFFPRRLAKTEFYGYGLMDLGAASSIVAGGIMSSSSTTKIKPPKFRQWLVFIGLGLLRLVTHKNVEYQEHVSEYGLHWNFYFTLAFISISSPMIHRITHVSSSSRANLAARWIIPSLLLCFYQGALQIGLQDYIENAPRRCPLRHDNPLIAGRSARQFCDLVAANREGVFGCVGYVALWWISRQIAEDCIWVGTQPKTNGFDATNARSNGLFRRGSSMRLALVSAALWLLHAILVYGMNISVSRRTTNASFCVWTLAHNFSLLTMFWWVLRASEEGDGGHSLLPPMCVAVNRHGMPAFVVANLLTGLVNLSIPTLETSNTTAMFILLSYLILVGCLALALDGLSFLLRPSSSRPKQD